MISVFLIIILVPTMVFSALLVDGSRMVSARAIAQEAADLAAAGVLSNYNSTLKEEFGLFALDDSADAETIFKESLSATLQASGLEGETYSEQVWGILKDAAGAGNAFEGKSFLNLYDFQIDETSVTPLYSLANPEVLQNQIVEYSKYRGLYVISERLGLLNSISDITQQVEDQEEAAGVMEEKMEIDEENGKGADKKISSVRGYVTELNGKLKQLEGIRGTFFSCLDAEMAVLAEVEDLSRETRELAENYESVKGSTQDFFDQLHNSVWNLDLSLPGAISDTQSAISRLSGFIGKYNGSSNETVQDLVEDARRAQTSYEECLREMQELQGNDAFRTLKDQDIGWQMSGVVSNIDSAVSRYSAEQDPEDDEDAYKFYYYESQNNSEDAGDVKPGYESAWTGGLVISESVQVPEVSSSTDHYGGNESGEDLRESAEEESGTNAKSEAMKYGTDQGSIPAPVYDTLPSKVFDPQEEADSYSSVLEEDLDREAEGVSAPDVSSGTDVPETSLSFYNEEGNLDGAESALAGGDSFLDGLQDVAEGARDEVLTLSYIFGTFKTRMTGNETFKKGGVSEDQLDEFYIVPWRYLYEDGEQDLQFEAKSERDTVLNAEIEYLIYGLSSDRANEAAAYASIYAPRMANNMVALYQNETVKGACDAAAVIASAATSGAVPATVFFWIFLTAWAVAETVLDMQYLIEYGYRIPFIKTKDTVLLTVDFTAGASDGLVNNYKSQSGSDRNLYVCYEDYLLLFLLLTGSDTRLMRMADLIQLNMQQEEISFRMDEAYTYVRAKTDLSIRYLFLDTDPLSQGYEEAGVGGRMHFKNVIYQGY